MFNKKFIRILLCILVVASGLAFPKTIVKASGIVPTGWKQSGGTWYYLNSKGINTTGWVKTSGKWYYLKTSGKMAIGWIQTEGKWYYLSPSGAMSIGWIKDGGTWFYLNSSGAMATGWLAYGFENYYLYSSGAMALNTTIQGHVLGSDGARKDKSTTGSTTSSETSVTAVSLNKVTNNIVVGEVYNLVANVLPSTAINKAVTWTSSNNAIVSVDKTGRVAALGAGTAIITVATTDGSKFATCSVSAISPVVKVTGVSLNKNMANLTVSGTNTLISVGKDALVATVTPYNATNKTIIWTSSNNYIVAVDNAGKVRALNPGTSIITATTADGSMTSTCFVTVNLASVNKATGVSLNKTSDTLIIGETHELISSVSPSTANEAVTWTSSNPGVVIVDNTGKISGISLGTATIIAITIDGSYVASCNVVVAAKSKITFAIDIGHNSNYDTGAVGIRSEDITNREVGTRVMAKLINLGYNVVDCSPTNATSLVDSLKQRTDIANASKADYYVAIHFNIFDGSVSGSEVFIFSDTIKTKAQQVLNNIVSLGYDSRGVKYETYYVLRNTDMPAMLIECSFLDSAGDMAKYDPDAFADAIVKGLISGN